MQITYIGHATTLIEIDGVRLLTDPILRNRILHLKRKRVDLQPAWFEKIDAVLISHLHWDHLHIPSLRQLSRDIPLIVPTGSAGLFEKEGFAKIEEVELRDRFELKGVVIEAVYADHDSSRIFSKVSADSIGYLIRGKQSIYFPGDTDIFPEMADLTDNLDLALMPVWGWGPTLGVGHMNPYRAALALRLLEPRMAIPIHWGTLFPIGFDLLDPNFINQPPYAFAKHAAELAPDVRVHIVQPGEAMDW